MTNWKPDTCKCSIDLNPFISLYRCPRHENSSVEDVMTENRQINTALRGKTLIQKKTIKENIKNADIYDGNPEHYTN